jgi:2-hydroxy-6-oxo-octa-2,4-dienoate hydrolase
VFAPERVNKLVLLGTPAGEFVQTPGLRGAWEYEPSLDNMRELMKLFPYDVSLITDAMVQARYEASARPGAQQALRKLIPQPAVDGPTLVKGFPPPHWPRSSRRRWWCTVVKTAWCRPSAGC